MGGHHSSSQTVVTQDINKDITNTQNNHHTQNTNINTVHHIHNTQYGNQASGGLVNVSNDVNAGTAVYGILLLQ